MRNAIWLSLIVLAAACSTAPKPVAVDPGAACGLCQQAVANPLFAAQFLEPGEPPVMFDDIGCLMDYLAKQAGSKPGSIAYVTDHHTGAWTRAADALYTRNLQVRTPRDSHLLAHASSTSQTSDPDARMGTRVAVRELLSADMPDGRR